MALYHFHVTQIRRSAGQSAVAAAAYRAGEKLHSAYYGETADYTRKGGVVCAEILLPAHAPQEYADRETLWNAVEQVERHPKAQLAYSFDIALQNEFSLEENINLARQFLLDEFVSRGMIADFAVHQPDKGGGIANPHFHVLCPIRPLNPDGTWGAKQRRAYVLDEDGNRIRNKAGKAVFNAVPTTDWGSPERLEAWREAWATLCNQHFAEKDLPDRIDHRSYARQGVNQVPTIHEGPAVREMEARGIQTDKGKLNRWIRRMNALRKRIGTMLADLAQRLEKVKAAMEVRQAPTLLELVMAYFDNRNAAAWSLNARLGNLKSMSQMIQYLREHDLRTTEDLETVLAQQQDRLAQQKASAKAVETRLKDVSELLRQAQNYADTKPVYDKWYAMKFKGRKEKYKDDHEAELRRYHAANRKLQRYFKDGKLPLTTWKRELEALQVQYTAEQTALKALQQEVRNLRQITLAVQGAMQAQEEQNRQHSQTRECR